MWQHLKERAQLPVIPVPRLPRRAATSRIKSATVVEVPAMRRSAASNSPEQVSLDLFCITVIPLPKRSSGPKISFGIAVSGQQASMQNEPSAVTVASMGGEGVARATKTK